MCPEPAWWEMAAGWGTVAITALITAAIAGPVGYLLLSSRMWWRRVKMHLIALKRSARIFGVAAATVLVLAAVSWSVLMN